MIAGAWPTFARCGHSAHGCTGTEYRSPHHRCGSGNAQSGMPLSLGNVLGVFLGIVQDCLAKRSSSRGRVRGAGVAGASGLCMTGGSADLSEGAGACAESGGVPGFTSAAASSMTGARFGAGSGAGARSPTWPGAIFSSWAASVLVAGDCASPAGAGITRPSAVVSLTGSPVSGRTGVTSVASSAARALFSPWTAPPDRFLPNESHSCRRRDPGFQRALAARHRQGRRISWLWGSDSLTAGAEEKGCEVESVLTFCVSDGGIVWAGTLPIWAVVSCLPFPG